MDIEMADLHEISTLGYGTFGIVRLVEHHPSGARYALKCISRTEAVARRQQTSICTEREILTDVDHPFILKLVQTFKDRRNVYFLTEFVTGGELFGAIRSLGILNGSQARFYTGSLILALQALHEKMIIYRDLKPENVLLDNYGYIKLIDFGCAARLNKGGHRSLVGTPHYMAPEVILGKEYNCSCDVWSLGVCLYEFVCGPLPFGQDLEDPKQVFQEILLAKVSFPEHFTNLTGKHLLRSLLRKNSQLRIGGVNGLQDVSWVPSLFTVEDLDQGVNMSTFESLASPGFWVATWSRHWFQVRRAHLEKTRAPYPRIPANPSHWKPERSPSPKIGRPSSEHATCGTRGTRGTTTGVSRRGILVVQGVVLLH
ncbi:unnamed protein product [Cladocopium goreaui]|uniref:cAMP-dependent protein kinase catalytic subunit (PKA C) n=1 Tax=Cladocopium goreaui TaxID=2562237 RepID=A0A9P1D1A4_9DINO|nr:unnamed protein product [Cladocopium goreaui]